MCYATDHIILTESDNAQISWCKGCKSYSLVYNSCCLSFTETEIIQFKELLLGLNQSDFHYSFFGQPHALLKYDFVRFGVALKQSDIKSLINLIREALTVNEIFGIIYK